MRVLLTGHRGYIGAHLTERLRAAGHHVTGCDNGLFQGSEWYPLTLPHTEWHRDYRSIDAHELSSFDVIMHLAALSNDPLGALDPALTHDINGSSVVDFALKAKAAGVTRFLFASSCALYGKSGNDSCDESAPLNPLSAYAEAKLYAERGLLAMADDSFCPISLRSATAFGTSPSLRIDLVANNLLASAFTLGDIGLLSDGTPLRPLVHCKDIANCFIALAEAPRSQIAGRALNIGSNAANYQVQDIANCVRKLIPNACLRYARDAGPDPRSYKVDFNALTQVLPHFQMEHDLERGLEELLMDFQAYHFDAEDFHGKRYVRLRWLSHFSRSLKLSKAT